MVMIDFVPVRGGGMAPLLRKPKIVVLISHLKYSGNERSRLALALDEVLPRYEGLALVKVIETSVGELLSTAKRIEGQDGADAILCSGASAEFLRKKVSTLILPFRMGEYDLIRALNVAKERGTKAGIMVHQRTLTELEHLTSLFTVEVRQSVYTSFEDAQDKVNALVEDGCHVIIGSHTVVELAERAGAVGVFAVNADAVRKTIDEALAICESRVQQLQTQQRTLAALQHLNEGVIGVDNDLRVFSVNTSMNKLLPKAHQITIGDDVRQAFPSLNLWPVINSGNVISSQLFSVGNESLSLSISPILEDDNVQGAIVTCQKVKELQRAERHIRAQSRPSQFVAKYQFSDIIGDHPAFAEMVKLAMLYARSDSTVLISGESGTGKEMFAQSIHNESNRSEMPFVAVNCAAFPESLLESELFGYEEGAFTGTRKGGKSGIFENAHNGTIFLDEIGDMPIHLQTRMLRVLQEREVLRLGATEPTPINIRVIAATHRDLSELIGLRAFREDLFFRLNTLSLSVPPLRERASDIPILSKAILRRIAERAESDDVQAAGLLNSMMPGLIGHIWKGNIRELENIIERAYLVSRMPEGLSSRSLLFPELQASSIEHFSKGQSSRPASLSALTKATEVAQIREVLKANDGDMGRTAKELGISRSTLWRRLKNT